MSKQKAIQEREALIEMYKAGFLDAYKISHRVRSKKDWEELNKKYAKAFMKRFYKTIKKVLMK